MNPWQQLETLKCQLLCGWGARFTKLFLRFWWGSILEMAECMCRYYACPLRSRPWLWLSCPCHGDSGPQYANCDVGAHTFEPGREWPFSKGPLVLSSRLWSKKFTLVQREWEATEYNPAVCPQVTLLWMERRRGVFCLSNRNNKHSHHRGVNNGKGGPCCIAIGFLGFLVFWCRLMLHIHLPKEFGLRFF